MTKKAIEIPKFATEAEEAHWSRLVGKLNGQRSCRLLLRLPEPDVAKARELAGQTGVGYQTLLKMLVHGGLTREAPKGKEARHVPAPDRAPVHVLKAACDARRPAQEDHAQTQRRERLSSCWGIAAYRSSIYDIDVIVSFKDGETERIFNGVRSRKFGAVANVAYRKLAILHSAATLHDLKSPGLQLEALREDRTGQHSIRINDRY